jgi:hypothetical protein
MARKYNVSASHDEGAWRFRCTKSPVLRFGADTIIPHNAWEAATGDLADAVRLLRALLGREGVRITEDEMIVPEDVIASFEVAPGELEDIGLPPLCPFRISISSARPITDIAGSIQVSWLGADYVPVPAVTRSGTLLKTGKKSFLLRDPLRSLVDAIERTNVAADIDERMRRFAEVRRQLMEMTREVTAPDNLRNMIIHQATALKIETELGPDGYRFHPELLGEIPADGEDEAPRRVSILGRLERMRFQRQMEEAHASGREEARPSYVLTSNTYVVLDPGVRAALKVVRQVSRSSRETRQAFFDDKYSFLLPALREVGSDGSVIEFSDRVIGVARWEGGANLGGSDRGQEWFPDAEATTYVVRDARGEEIHIPAEKADETVRAIREAVAAGQPSISIGGRDYQLDASMLDEVARIPILERPTPKAQESRSEPRGYYFVKPKGNVEELTYVEDRAGVRGRDLTDKLGLLNQPQKHQAEGIAWMQRGYLVGMRGLLMADDMGLGKTFQVLAFLKWLSGRVEKTRGPGSDPLFMVVAPKSLLGNWLEEVETHIGKDGLGKPALLFGENLKAFRKVKKRRDIETGEEMLDREKLQGFDWVLTTYETLRDYQISFAKVNFEVVTFDEAQKIKESGAMVTEAARSQKAASLRILMTGTPVENGLMDLWTLMDVAWPGRLGYSGADFRKTFVKDKEADLSVIRKLLTESTNDNGIVVPQLMLRRMKDAVTDLPRKDFVPLKEAMPKEQAEAYSRAVEMQSKGGFSALAALQAIRNISLHPNMQAPIDYGSAASRDAFIGMSARLSLLFRILDDVRARNEKALVFVDLRRAQAVLAELIMRRYKLAHRPHVINGETSAESRDAIRRGFQKRPGFEVLMLAPRAAGFGLTLHAGNHVIHLNRWWNPAVEDQCTDRAYRIGQTKDVKVWIPIAEHPVYKEKSYDVVLDKLLEGKRKVSGDIIVPVQFDPAEMAGLHSTVFGDTPFQSDLARMDWKSFEGWTIQRLIDAGLVADRTPVSGDAGADTIAKLPSDQTRGAIIQIKHRSRGKLGTVSEGEVLDVLRARERYPVRKPSFVLVTNGSVEPAGMTAAGLHGITVIDHSSIEKVGEVVHSAICAS